MVGAASWRILDEYSERIEHEVASYFRSKRAETRYDAFSAHVYETLEAYVMREGTRLASCSALVVYNGYMNQLDAGIVKVAAGLELYRHAILIHDDIIDRDELRRGGPAFHTLLGSPSTSSSEGSGLVAGNLLYALALDCIRRAGYAEQLRCEVLACVNEAYRAVNESQLLDLRFEQTEPDEDAWYQMAANRAGSLFRAATRIGAILAKAPASDIPLLRDAAMELGYALDIRDDIMGTFGTEAECGRKPVGDLRRFKKPLQVIYTLEQAPASVIADLEMMVRAGEFDGARAVIRTYGLASAKERTRAHAANALAFFEETTLSNEPKEFFRDLLGYLVKSLERY